MELKLSGRSWKSKIHSRDQPVRSEDFREDIQGSSEKFQPTDETKGDVEARHDFLSIEGDFICRHHVEYRV